MSQYGPALFIKRKDENDIDEKEQKKLLELVTKISKELNIKDENDNVISPDFYDYDEYEEKSVSFLMYSSVIFDEMPEDIRQDQEEGDAEIMLEIGDAIDKIIPDTYSYKCYYVED